jgi:hypothetical protein
MWGVLKGKPFRGFGEVRLGQNSKEVSEKFEKLVRTPKLVRQFHGVSTKRHETARPSKELKTSWTAPPV